MTAVASAIVEIDERLAAFAPILEGLRDYARLNLEPEAHDLVMVAIEDYQRRTARLEVAKDGLAALEADGHPDMPKRAIEPAALVDLQANAATIEAALAQFTEKPAPRLILTAGRPVPK